MSKSIPFLQYAGNVGFDPLGLAKDEDTLIKYREAKMKHARLAMLVRTNQFYVWNFPFAFEERKSLIYFLSLFVCSRRPWFGLRPSFGKKQSPVNLKWRPAVLLPC